MNLTSIEYLDMTWNPIAMRCTPVSSGCANCWHLSMCKRLAKNPSISTLERHAYGGGLPVLRHRELESPLNRKKPAVIGVQFMGDLWHESIPEGFIDKVWLVMAAASQHTFVCLTKRARNMMIYLSHHKEALPNVVVGVSVENNETLNDRVAWLLQAKAATRILSVEPAIDYVDPSPFLGERARYCRCGWTTHDDSAHTVGGGDICGVCLGYYVTLPTLDGVIMGCESGRARREMKATWVDYIRMACEAFDTPFFLKQMVVDGKLTSMPKLNGMVHDSLPWTGGR